MFDLTKIGGGESHSWLVPYDKTVIEKRAPTDESIKLLNEMQEKAYDNITAIYRCENNKLQFSVVEFKPQPNYSLGCRDYYLDVRIELNNNVYNIPVLLDRSITTASNGEERWEIFKICIMKAIEENIMSNLFDELYAKHLI